MYDQFYGLSGRPFQLTPDPQYYFESATHRKALSYLGYGLAQGEGFIVITGEVGAGKSTLVGHLMQSIDKVRMNAATIVTSQLDGADMVNMAAESFGIDTRGMDKAAALSSIQSFLHAEARAGRRCLLIVDEAQNLSIEALEELRMLSNFQLGSTALLQIFLLGQPEFRHLVNNAPELEQLRQRIIATHHLEPMDADEVQPYIEHRLTRAGWTGRPQLTADAYDALHDETGGVPRKLNTLMNRVMLMGSVEQVETIDGDLVRAVIADMAGKPFEYEAPLSARAPEMAAAEPLVEAEQEAEMEAERIEAEQEPEAIEELAAQEIEPEMVEEPIAAAAGFAALPEEVAFTPATPLETSESNDALSARVAALEARVIEQEAALRRVLAMLIDWMDKEAAASAHFSQSRAA